jgi:hypothetical protein
MRIGASVNQDLQLISVPRGALMTRLLSNRVASVMAVLSVC